MPANCRGYPQVDAAPGYDDVFAQHRRRSEGSCWTPARWYFSEAMLVAAVVCAQVLAISAQLYAIERAAAERHLNACRLAKCHVGGSVPRHVFGKRPHQHSSRVCALTPVA